jgi:hypothetical protein
VAVSKRGEPLPPSHCPLRLRRPLRSRRWPLSFGSEEEVAEMTATAMSSRWLQRKRVVDADESGWGEEVGRRARQRMMDARRRRTTTTQQRRHNNQTFNERGRRKMAATTGDGRWTITATTTVRGNARGGEEEVHAMKEDEGVGGARTTHDGR